MIVQVAKMGHRGRIGGGWGSKQREVRFGGAYKEDRARNHPRLASARLMLPVAYEMGQTWFTLVLVITDAKLTGEFSVGL